MSGALEDFVEKRRLETQEQYSNEEYMPILKSDSED